MGSQAFLYAAKQRTVGKHLNKAFQKSFQACKWIRSNTNIGKGQINVATVAVDLALKVFGDLRESTVIVIGAGDIAEKTVAALRSRGAKNLILCNRTFSKAQELVRPICLLDLALPRDIDPGIDHLPNVFLYNLDDLAEIAESNLTARKKELSHCHEYIEKKVQHVVHGHTPPTVENNNPRQIKQA